MLIIGCGNRHRGDDGVGILVVERLREVGLEAEIRISEPPDLIETLKSVDDVIVVDAVLTGAPAGTIQVWDGHELPVFASTAASTHGFGVAEAVKLARALNRLPARLRIYGIEGKRFDPGTEVSSEVRLAIEDVVRGVIAEAKRPAEQSWPISHRPALA